MGCVNNKSKNKIKIYRINKFKQLIRTKYDDKIKYKIPN